MANRRKASRRDQGDKTPNLLPSSSQREDRKEGIATAFDDPALMLPDITDKIDPSKEPPYTQKPTPVGDLPPVIPPDISEKRFDAGHERATQELDSALLQQQNQQLTVERDALLQQIEELKKIAQESSAESSRLHEHVQTVEAELEQVRQKLAALTAPPAKKPAPPLSVEELFAEPPPLFTGGRGNDPLEFLKEHYGHLLVYFGAGEDRLYLHKLRDYDKFLVETLATKLSRRRKKELESLSETTVPTLGEIVPDEKTYGDRLLADKTLAEVFEDTDMARLVCTRTTNFLKSLRKK